MATYQTGCKDGTVLKTFLCLSLPSQQAAKLSSAVFKIILPHGAVLFFESFLVLVKSGKHAAAGRQEGWHCCLIYTT